jgi:rRNA maturation RNase YbeY
MISHSFYSKEYHNLPLASLEDSIPKLVLEEGKELADIALVFCSDDELLSLNQKHLDHDYFTDIITFDYSNDPYISGDLFISVDRVLDNANIEGVSFNEEMHRVVFHGILHLLGFNDKSTEEIGSMREKENYYLGKLFHVKHV